MDSRSRLGQELCGYGYTTKNSFYIQGMCSAFSYNLLQNIYFIECSFAGYDALQIFCNAFHCSLLLKM